MPTCFVIMPITTPPEHAERYGGDRDHFRHVLDHLIAPAVERAEHELIHPIAEGADLIHAEIVKNLENADLVLCDISTLNANVFFELGIRTSLDRPTCLIRDEHTSLPFDTGTLNFHQYRCGLNLWHVDEDVEMLADHIRVSAERSKGRNTLWQYFGLTQRGVRAKDAAEASPDSDKLDYILAEVQRLDRKLADASEPTDAAVERFLEDARSLLGDVSSRVTIGRDGRPRVALFIPDSPPGTVRNAIHARASFHGVTAQIHTAR